MIPSCLLWQTYLPISLSMSSHPLMSVHLVSDCTLRFISITAQSIVQDQRSIPLVIAHSELDHLSWRLLAGRFYIRLLFHFGSVKQCIAGLTYRLLRWLTRLKIVISLINQLCLSPFIDDFVRLLIILNFDGLLSHWGFLGWVEASDDLMVAY